MVLSFENKIINQFQVTVFKKPRAQHIINRTEQKLDSFGDLYLLMRLGGNGG